MSIVRVTRRYRFSASHRLHSPLLGEQENRDTYGKCNNPYGHGHDYELEVTVRGPVQAAPGRLVPLDVLDRLVQTKVLNDMDRRNLNVEVPEFATLVPTTENLALVVEHRLRQSWSLAFADRSVGLEKIKIRETKRNIFEV